MRSSLIVLTCFVREKAGHFFGLPILQLVPLSKILTNAVGAASFPQVRLQNHHIIDTREPQSDIHCIQVKVIILRKRLLQRRKVVPKLARENGSIREALQYAELALVKLGSQESVADGELPHRPFEQRGTKTVRHVFAQDKEVSLPVGASPCRERPLHHGCVLLPLLIAGEPTDARRRVGSPAGGF